ncbi:MAG: sigma-54-dependent Fis family transcriptional regulator [Acidobacteria bacterium]|nr:sigma-54-dependent Fis family transcriptional regulator [Acidobacteriota bacterium]
MDGETMEPTSYPATAGHLDGAICFEGPAESIYRVLRKVSIADAGLIIWGESGTGKNLYAWLSHQLSPRNGGPYLEISCASLPESLVETELFGHTRGAFTGAAQSHPGRLSAADGGTLILDELENLSPSSQAKLLRVVESGRFTPIGGERERNVDIRFIGLTQENPELLVQRGILRKDLYYRLALFSLALPNLRDHAIELPAMIAFVVRQEAARLKKEPVRLEPVVTETLCRYTFPGNFRELQNIVRRWSLLQSGGKITLSDVPERIRRETEPGHWPSLEELERDYIIRILRHTRGKKSEAARLLGIHRKTLLEKRKLYDLE